MYSIFSVFLVAVLVVLFLLSYYASFLTIRLFDIKKTGLKFCFRIAFFLLSLGFIFSIFLVRYNENIITKWMYIVFGIWIGTLFNYMLVMTIVFVLYKIVLRFVKNVNVKKIGAAGALFALFLSIYGGWNAYYNLQVKEITVALKNLPEEWKGKKAVQISDVHLGVIYGPEFLVKVVSKINELNPDLVFITGDFFDGMDGDLVSKIAPLKKLKVKSGIFFVTGNHENYLGVMKAEGILRDVGVQVLDDEVVDLNGLQIIGINYQHMVGSADVEKIIGTLEAFDKNKASILLYHGPQGIAQAKAAGVNLQLSGHSHRGQIFPIGVVSELVFGKYYYGLNIEGDYSIYTSSGVGTWGPMMRTSGVPEIVLITLK